MFDYQNNLSQLNSLTKYPSILTYHELGDKGILQPKTNVTFTGTIHPSEKVDGTNTRFIFLPDGEFFIGGREELLYYSRDLLFLTTQNIVANTKDFVRKLWGKIPLTIDSALVVWGETYGGNIGSAAKNYGNLYHWRMFDAALFSDMTAFLAKKPEEIASWRDNGGTPFLSYNELVALSERTSVERVPDLGTLNANDVPTGIVDTYEWLKTKMPQTLAKLDDTAKGESEGLILRSSDRKQIAKLRFEDYQRTIKKLNLQ